MASYHCTVRVGAKGSGGPHSEYICRQGKYSKENAGRYEDLDSTGSGNLPLWAAYNPVHFWHAADQYERANGAVYREIEIALPRELTPDQNRELVADFIDQEIGVLHAYQWAIHRPRAALEKGEQPHAHIMYSERTLDSVERDPEQYFKRANKKNPERGGCVKDSAGTEERLLATRARWATVQNKHLERYGHTDRVTHASLKEQGIERQPEKHLGPSVARKMRPQEVAALLERRAAEGQLERSQRTVGLIDLSGDLLAAKAERARQQHAKQQAAAREFAHQAAVQFKAEQAARDFAKNAAEQFKAEMFAKAQAEQAQRYAVECELARQKQEAGAKQQAEIDRHQLERVRRYDRPGRSR